LITSLAVVLDCVRKAGLWLSSDVERLLLEQAGE